MLGIALPTYNGREGEASLVHSGQKPPYQVTMSGAVRKISPSKTPYYQQLSPQRMVSKFDDLQPRLSGLKQTKSVTNK